MSKKILVVEDDLQIQEIIVEFLSSQNYQVHKANNGVEGYELIKELDFDLIILDIMMPKLDGYSLCKMIRSKDEDVGIIFLTALGSEEDEVKGFDLNIDDYITKPFSYNVLIKRVEAVLRRKDRDSNTNQLIFEDIKIDLDSYKVIISEIEKELTLKEFNILKILIQNYPSVVTRDLFIEKVWGYDFYGDTRVIDAHVKNIRKKIQRDYIKTVKGIGYVLKK